MELDHPFIFFDNLKLTNVITIPDLGGYNVDVPSYWECKNEMDSVTATEWDNKRPSAYWRGFNTGTPYEQNKAPEGRQKLVMSSMLNGTGSAYRGNFGLRTHDDLKAMPLDALFSNRSSLEFDDTFPITRDVFWREVMANMFEC